MNFVPALAFCISAVSASTCLQHSRNLGITILATPVQSTNRNIYRLRVNEPISCQVQSFLSISKFCKHHAVMVLSLGTSAEFWGYFGPPAPLLTDSRNLPYLPSSTMNTFVGIPPLVWTYLVEAHHGSLMSPLSTFLWRENIPWCVGELQSTVQRSAKVDAPGCVNAAGELGQM